jgi:hypothetical protein
MKRAILPILLALSTVPTCASLPAPTDGTYVERANLPAFPSSVPSTFGPVRVVLVKHLRGCGTVDTLVVFFGCYHYGAKRFIEIEDTLSLVMKWRTLSHERVHLALDLDGAKLGDPDEENRAAEAIAKQETHAMLLGWPR